MSKRKVILSLIIVALTSAGAYWWFQSKDTITMTALSGCSFGEYKVQSIGYIGFCGDDEVLDSNNKHVVTLRLCEDNICTIEKKEDWIVISTTAGRTFKKNVSTREEILNAEGGVGGMSKVK